MRRAQHFGDCVREARVVATVLQIIQHSDEILPHWSGAMKKRAVKKAAKKVSVKKKAAIKKAVRKVVMRATKKRG